MNKNNILNIRQKQAYGAICLWHFCKYTGITHDSINQLIKHLLSILTAQNLSNWEQEGALLVITGRGDPLPIDVENVIDKQYLNIFNFLVECCVEIGIVDMYGDSTQLPNKFLDDCINTLIQMGILPPPLEPLEQINNGDSDWGAVITDAEFSKLLCEYNIKTLS